MDNCIEDGDLVKTSAAAQSKWGLPLCHEGVGVVLESYEDDDGIPYVNVFWSTDNNTFLDKKSFWYPRDALILLEKKGNP